MSGKIFSLRYPDRTYYEATTRGLIIRGPATTVGDSTYRTFKLELDCRFYNQDPVIIYLVENDSPTSKWDIVEDLSSSPTCITRRTLGRVFAHKLSDHVVPWVDGCEAGKAEHTAFKVPWNLPVVYLSESELPTASDTSEQSSISGEDHELDNWTDGIKCTPGLHSPSLHSHSSN